MRLMNRASSAIAITKVRVDETSARVRGHIPNSKRDDLTEFAMKCMKVRVIAREPIPNTLARASRRALRSR